MYKIIKCISVLVRLFFLPNPFDSLPQYPTISIFGAALTLTPDLLNWIAEPILHFATFFVVGCFYSSGGDDPSTGSFLYLLFYIIHVALLMGLAALNFAVPAVVLIIGGYAAILYLLTRWHNP